MPHTRGSQRVSARPGCANAPHPTARAPEPVTRPRAHRSPSPDRARTRARHPTARIGAYVRPRANVFRYGTTGLGSSFAAHRPELKSVNSTLPFHGIAFITNGAFAV
jgi:hypothetical protein